MVHFAIYKAKHLQVPREIPHEKVRHESDGPLSDRVFANVKHTDSFYVQEPQEELREALVVHAVVVEYEL